jgi:Flp pilus assembly protein TadB
MNSYWVHYWWLIFPLLGFGICFSAMWMRYQRQKATIELLRGYASQGKDPPAELVKVLQEDHHQRGPDRDWRRAVLFGALAAAFATMAYLHYGPSHGLVFGAIVLGALAVSSAVSALLLRQHDPQ